MIKRQTDLPGFGGYFVSTAVLSEITFMRPTHIEPEARLRLLMPRGVQTKKYRE